MKLYNLQKSHQVLPHSQCHTFPYTEKEDYEFECENCGRTFLLTSGFDWWYTTTPIEKEIKNILEVEDVED